MSFCRWYNYITQITRMFDEETHKEFQFCNFLLKLLPNESVKDFDLEGKLKLEYYKLKKMLGANIGLFTSFVRRCWQILNRK